MSVGPPIYQSIKYNIHLLPVFFFLTCSWLSLIVAFPYAHFFLYACVVLKTKVQNRYRVMCHWHNDDNTNNTSAQAVHALVQWQQCSQ